MRVGYDGRVYKTFRGTDADKRFANEIEVLKVLEERGCDFVPRILDADEETLTLTTTNCGHPVQSISAEKTQQLFDELKTQYGVIHDDPFDRNITYHQGMGRFCVIDFELAQVLPLDSAATSTGTDLAVSWFGRSVAGSRKPGNEDALAVFRSRDGWAEELPLEGQQNIAREGIVLAVSDGMGGVAGGGYASHLVVNELRRFLPAQMGEFHNAAEPLHDLAEAVRQLNGFVNRIARTTPGVHGMGATLVCGMFSRRELHFAHVGDSRIYCFDNGALEQLTFDDSRVGRMFRKGEINERQARTHPCRNTLDQVIGNNNRRIAPQVGSRALHPGMWFLFCSDGIVDGLWNRRIEREFARSQQEGRSVSETAEVLIAEAAEAAGKDDTTLFVAHIDAAPASPEATTRDPTTPAHD